MGADYETIGEFYGAIRDGVSTLATQAGAKAFLHDGRQVNGAEIGIPGVIVIGDVTSAVAALQLVIDQGEGATEESKDCHFARFSRIKAEWADLLCANPAFEPAHPAAADPVMRKPVDVARTWITSPEALPILDLGNAIYGALLLALARMYGQVKPLERQRLARCAVKLMHGLSRLGERLARLPAGERHRGMNAGITFAVPRNVGPRGSVGVLRERLAELAEAYGALENTNPIADARDALNPD